VWAVHQEPAVAEEQEQVPQAWEEGVEQVPAGAGVEEKAV